MNRFQRFRQQRTTDKHQQAETQHNNAEKQLEAVNDAARSVRNLFVTYVLISSYFIIIIAGTTHEQLLRESPIRLPILNTDIPITGFYLFAPALYWALHFNLLLQSWLLARKYRQFLRYKPNRTLRHRLLNLSLLQWLDNEQSPLQTILSLVVTATYIILPIIILLLAQRGFLPYHDIFTTWVHRLVVITDIVLLWCFIPKILNFQKLLTWKTVFTPPSLFTAGTLCCSFILLTIPHEAIFGDLLPPRAGSSVFNRNLDLREKILTQNTLTAETINQLRSSDSEKIKQAQNQILGIHLQKRDLNYANLRGTILPKADLREVQLQGAYLWEAELQGANLSGAELQGANLWHAELQGADLSGAELQGADLRWAELQGADLRRTGLQGADLSRTGLQGANLWEADLQGANLWEADLQSADLSRTGLQGADLSRTGLQGADLRRANLQYADLHSTDIGMLTAKAIEKIINALSKGLEAHQIATLKKRLQKRVNQATIFKDVSSDSTCLMSQSITGLNCVIDDKPASATYTQKLTKYLADLACESLDIATGITNHRLSPEFDFEALYLPALAIPLAAQLENTQCSGIQQLPDDLKQKIRMAAAAVKQATSLE